MRRFLPLFILVFALTGCAARPVDTGEVVIYTSFNAMYDFTRTIAGDAVQVNVLLPPGVSVHHWEPSAQEMVRLSDADAFIYHGSGMEHFSETLRNSLAGELVFVEASEGIEPGYEGGDPHLWLNPLYALEIMVNIKESLIEVDPGNASIFEANFNEASRKIHELDAAYREAAGSFIRRDLVVAHGAFAHLSHAYGLNQMPISGQGDHAEPSPARMAELISFVQENNVSTIFYDSDPTLARAVADASGADAVMLDTFEGLTEDDYFTVMRRNLEVLINALS